MNAPAHLPTRPTRLALVAVVALALALIPLAGIAPVNANASDTSTTRCNVTLPNDDRPPGAFAYPENRTPFYGNGKLWVVMWWMGGIIHAGVDAGVPEPGGISIKTPWFQGPESSGDLVVTGTRLDGPAPAIGQHEGPGEEFHPTGIVYPSLGCWQITGRAGSTSLTFTVWVTFPANPNDFAEDVPSAGDCPVTVPPVGSTGPQGALPNPVDYVGHDGLWVQRPATGILDTIPPGPYARDRVYSAKVLWYRDGAARGTLTVTGHPLPTSNEANAPKLKAEIPAGYGDTGLQVTGLEFPALGCWQITATSRAATLTFVIYVISSTPQTPPATPAWNARQTDDSAENSVSETPPASCHVTVPNGNRPPPSLTASGDGFYGNGKLWVAMWWHHGTIRAGIDAGVPTLGGVSIKTPWFQGPESTGDLKIVGRRLDGPAPIISQEEGPGEGFHPTGIVYSTPGCWRITGSVGATSLTFTVWVMFTPEIDQKISPARNCPVTTNADGDPGVPQYVIPGMRTGGNGTPPTVVYPSSDDFFGENGLWVGLWPNGVVRVDAGSSYVTPEGGVSMKFWMYRDDSAKGTITISGRRLDGASAPLTASVPEGYGDVGFQATGIDFPTPGCWEVTVHSGTAALTFVTLVEIVPAATPATPEPEATSRR